MAASLVPYCAMPVVATPAVITANRNVMKIVFLMGLISSPPPSDLGPAFQTLCQASSRSGERLKMIRTADLPPNNVEQNRTVLGLSTVTCKSRGNWRGDGGKRKDSVRNEPFGM